MTDWQWELIQLTYQQKALNLTKYSGFATVHVNPFKTFNNAFPSQFTGLLKLAVTHTASNYYYNE